VTRGARLARVSCPTVKMRVAVGELDDSYDNSTPFIETYNGKQWKVSWVGGAASLPSTLQPDEAGGEDGVSCPTVTFCAAIGTLTESDNQSALYLRF
jgi:hypothetical protein